MNNIIGAVVPHPPIAIPEIGRNDAEKVRETQEAMADLTKDLKDMEVNSLVFISPHGPVFQDGIGINGSSILKGSFANFGHPEIKFEGNNDLILVKEIMKAAQDLGIPTVLLDNELVEAYNISLDLDHGVLVPLYFIEEKGLSVPIVSITIGLLSLEELYQFGTAISKAAASLGKRVAVIASGDLSHRLTPDAPAGYNPEGKEFDEHIVKGISSGDIKELIGISEGCVEGAGECGLRPIIMMLGSLDKYRWEGKVLSYQGPFGVGYMVAKVIPVEKEETKVDKLYQRRKDELRERREEEDPLVKLARETLEVYVKEEREIAQPFPLDNEMKDKAGIFVSIKKHGQLRGCIGTIMPTTENIAQEVIHNAIQAGTQDPRFFPVEEDELDELVYSVDVLMPPESIKNVKELDVEKYGVIVRSGRKTGLLLPNLEGIETVGEQIRIAKEKAGIAPSEVFTMERFEVIRHK